ncbi:MAG: hypothetical protein GKS05_09145 [Nitrospirales bacterium]|nr:hypothetical protein [Nitrospirales bacterium]
MGENTPVLALVISAYFCARVGKVSFLGSIIMSKPTRKGRPVDPDTLLRLNSADWEKIYPALLLYARFKARSLYWRSGNTLDLAKGMNAEDVVNEAIRKVYEGERVWDPIKVPDLLEFLKSSTLASMFNELAESADNRLVQWLVNLF